MIEFDELEKKMVLKLVYYGPARSGKTTNLLKLHDLLSDEGRGGLMVLDTQDDRTIYFDLLPFFLMAPSGLRIKVKVYTVPGQVRHDATRKAVLQRADGVAFIADSQLTEKVNNSESFDNLEKNLSIVGLNIDKTPLVIQFNKRDLERIIPEPEIKTTWTPTGLPFFLASALEGNGVIETFSGLLGLMYDNIDRQYGLLAKHGLERETFLKKMTTKR
ncbi:MAG: GTPase [Proteobacteria bacterium]|nr:GTPase [Pseudomonadota bacterium]MBU1686918.1 GTPase [Pseudomonadota bacterium]